MDCGFGIVDVDSLFAMLLEGSKDVAQDEAKDESDKEPDEGRIHVTDSE